MRGGRRTTAFRIALLAVAIGVALLLRGQLPDAARTEPSRPPEGPPANAGALRGFREAAAQVAPGVRLHYVIGGRGPAVVLLHGFPQTWYCWRKVMPVLAREHTVVAVDLRGAGGSSVPAGGYDADTEADDVHALLERLGLARGAAVVGHDLGAWTAYAYAREHRDEVRALGFLEAGLPGFGLERSLDFSRPLQGIWHLAFFRQPEVPEALLRGHERYFLTDFLQPERAAPGAFDGGALERYVRAYAPPRRLHAALERYRALYRDAAANRARAGPKLTMPVLALGGARGSRAGPLAAMRQVATHVEGGVTPDAGHWLMEEQPEAVASRLRAFLRPRAHG
jgi:pimeloyl-ACP methyl ester carboxylesterase